MITSLILFTALASNPQDSQVSAESAKIETRIIEIPICKPGSMLEKQERPAACKPGMPCWKGNQKAATQKATQKSVCKTCKKQKVKYRYNPNLSWNENWRRAEAAGAFDYSDVGKDTDNQ